MMLPSYHPATMMLDELLDEQARSRNVHGGVTSIRVLFALLALLVLRVLLVPFAVHTDHPPMLLMLLTTAYAHEQLALRIAGRSQLQTGGGGGGGGGGGAYSGTDSGASGAALGVSSLPEAVEVAQLFVWGSGRGNTADVLHWSEACGAQPNRPPTAAELALPLCPICAGAGLTAEP